AKQFNEPLVDQRIRHENQHTFCPAGENEPMKNKTSFDRFAEAHFIGEQDSRRQSSGDFRSNEELVRDQIDARSNEATHLRFSQAVSMLERGESEVENSRGIVLTGK